MLFVAAERTWWEAAAVRSRPRIHLLAGDGILAGVRSMCRW
jgi:hypothetical protein